MPASNALTSFRVLVLSKVMWQSVYGWQIWFHWYFFSLPMSFDHFSLQAVLGMLEVIVGLLLMDFDFYHTSFYLVLVDFRRTCKAHIYYDVMPLTVSLVDTEDGMGLSFLLEILEPWACQWFNEECPVSCSGFQSVSFESSF